ncbi:TPA: superinfection exclusion protein [Klebsiella variicola]
MQKLRVWHIPQVPMKPFYVEVSSVREGVHMMDTLARYDAFQLENNIKPDYSNVNGLQVFDDTLSEQDLVDMELTDRWVDWYIETEKGYWDCPHQYLSEGVEEA